MSAGDDDARFGFQGGGAGGAVAAMMGGEGGRYQPALAGGRSLP